jgi:hypothetical protein
MLKNTKINNRNKESTYYFEFEYVWHLTIFDKATFIVSIPVIGPDQCGRCWDFLAPAVLVLPYLKKQHD